MGRVTGPLFLASIGVGFALVYLATPQNWWAIIPAGVMTTLALVAGVDELRLVSFDTGGLFFIGLGVTFLVVGLLPAEHGAWTRWAFIPAAVLIVIGVLISTSFEPGIAYLWPAALIVGGLVLIGRTLLTRRG
jgi:hypothetical protein